MTEPTLETALAVAAQPKDTRTVLDLIASMRPEIEKSLQSEAAADILVRHYYNAIRYNELLRQCTGESLVAALLLSAQVRLEPGPLGHVYLVPFQNRKAGTHEVVWMLGYTGIIELGRRGGAQGLRSTVIHERDDFTLPWENEKGLHWSLVPAPYEDRGKRVGALVTWKENGDRQGLHMPPERVAIAVKASRNPKASELAQEDWYWRKTAVRFARPWLPLSTSGADYTHGPRVVYPAQEMGQALAADGAAVHGLDVNESGEAFAVIEAGDDA